MGILSDGSPYLTLRGLARMCGVDESSIRGITGHWNDDPAPPRVSRIKKALSEQGFAKRLPYISIIKDGATHYACTDLVCMAFLEYYAFEARPAVKQAVDNYRVLARKTFRDFIYARIGYNPKAAEALAWERFHDRIDLVYDSVPDGYFSIFKETADVQLALIREGACPGCKFIPDSSIGNLWGKEWRHNNLETQFGPRVEYDHYYPESYPQHKSSLQGAQAYPDTARAYFKQWLREVYIRHGLPNYLRTKVADKTLSAPVATATLTAIQKSVGLAPPARRLPGSR
ncbi:hypothetical protein [Methylobacterium goesingense]|uniref:BstA-like C-terminal domain-containing protein n=1 Tax=Methylobacterium goesingense TaxID=243690 RepID=A0ABV2L3B3_9HYPH|nr:hypothetical protein [Methylobacterium goesingense]